MTDLMRNNINVRVHTFCLALAALFIAASISPTWAQSQSTDRDNPTLFGGKGVSGNLDGSGDEYFYKFVAGKGTLALTFRVTASSTNAGATLDLFDADNNQAILSNVLAQGVDGGTEKIEKSVQLGKVRNVIIMRIKGIRYGSSGGTGSFLVRVEKNVAPAGGDTSSASASSRFTGELDGTDSKQSHSVAITGAGKLTLIFDVKANSTNAGAYFDVLDGSGRALLSNVLVQGVDSGSERINKTLNFAKKQTITIRVTGIRYGSSGGQGVYTIKLSGPVGQN